MAWRLSRQNREKVEEDYSDLLIFGYTCKTFAGESKQSEFVNDAGNLMAHPQQSDNLMDRHDCRLHLVELGEYEHRDDHPIDEADVEPEIDDERYREMLTDHQLNEMHLEEEMKRLQAQTGEGGAEVGFNYDGENKGNVKEEQVESDDEPDVPYVPRAELKVPKGTTMPETVRENSIVEKTAAFIAAQGPQMEIVLKAKQKDAHKFAFLNFGHSLNGYYRHLVKMIRENKYTPIPPEPKKKKVKEEIEESESDSDSDGNYLHPSLLGGGLKGHDSSNNSPRNTGTPILPTIQYKLGEEDDVYSALFNKISALMPKKQEAIVKLEPTHTKESPPQEFAQWYEWFYGVPPPYVTQPKVIPPPPSLQAVVDKTADFVAKFGPKAEVHLRNRKELQLDFLDHSHMYYAYFQLKIRWTQYDDAMKSQYETTDAAQNPATQALPETEITPAVQSAVPVVVAQSALMRNSPGLLPTPATNIPPPFPHLINRQTTSTSALNADNGDSSGCKKLRGFSDLPTAETAAQKTPAPVSFAITQSQSDVKPSLPLPRLKQLETAESSGEEGEIKPKHEQIKDVQPKRHSRKHRKRRFDVPPPGFESAPPTVLIIGEAPPIVPPPIPPIPTKQSKSSISHHDIFDVEDRIEKAVDSNVNPSDKELQMQRKMRAQMFLNKLKAKKAKDAVQPKREKSRSGSRSPITSYP